MQTHTNSQDLINRLRSFGKGLGARISRAAGVYEYGKTVYREQTKNNGGSFRPEETRLTAEQTRLIDKSLSEGTVRVSIPVKRLLLPRSEERTHPQTDILDGRLQLLVQKMQIRWKRRIRKIQEKPPTVGYPNLHKYPCRIMLSDNRRGRDPQIADLAYHGDLEH